jgi:hypothetical protein
VKLGDDTIVLVDREPTGQRDRYGNDVLAPSYTAVEWCLVTPGTSTEPGDQSSARITGLDVLAPRGPADQLDAVDAVIYPATATGDPEQPWAGPQYEVDGDVGVWEDAVQARLTRSV